jgi:hypothetical protein
MQIEGLNKTQRALADIMWGMDSKDQVTAFIGSLRGQQQRDAQTVLELMLLAIWDECEDTQDACRVIDQFRLTD